MGEDRKLQLVLSRCETVFEMYNNIAPDFDSDSDKDDTDNSNREYDIGTLQFEDNEFTFVDPTDVPPLDKWQNVSAMIKKLHSNYRVVVKQWKKSGTHSGVQDVIHGMKMDLGQWIFRKKSDKYHFYFLGESSVVFVSCESLTDTTVMNTEHNLQMYTSTLGMLPAAARFESTNTSRTAAKKQTSKTQTTKTRVVDDEH